MGQFGKWVKMYCICQGWIWKSEFIPRLLLPQPLFRTQLKLTKDWGIRITTIHSNTKNIQPWFHIILVLFFGANKGFVGALYWAKHQIFPIFLLSQYTQCNIFSRIYILRISIDDDSENESFRWQWGRGLVA